MDNPSGVAGVTATEMGADQGAGRYGLMELYKQLLAAAEELRPRLKAAEDALVEARVEASVHNECWAGLSSLWHSLHTAGLAPAPPDDLNCTQRV